MRRARQERAVAWRGGVRQWSARSAFRKATATRCSIVTDDQCARLVPASSSDRYTRVEIKLFAGRSLEAKRALYRELVQNLAALGVPAQDTKIVLIEVEPP
ncbi:MAG: tautomerase family protein [Rhodopseudomonas palustris]|nr:tautomerase family protein [Rhodopseudomonas palustris]